MKTIPTTFFPILITHLVGVSVSVSVGVGVVCNQENLERERLSIFAEQI